MAAAEASEKSKGSPLIMMIVGLVVLTVLGAGGGWFLGNMVAPKIKTATAVVQAAAQAPTGEKQAALNQLEVALQIPCPISQGELRLHPFWDPLRGDASFDKLVAESATSVPIDLT